MCLAGRGFAVGSASTSSQSSSAAFEDSALVLGDAPAQPGLTADPDDDYLVALAREAGADFLVSGDQHLTGLVDAVPPVLTPRQFRDQLVDV